MNIGILATGTNEAELMAEYGSFADMVVQMFGRTECGFSFEVFDVRLGDFPVSAGQCDGWVVTGSKHSVYDELDWIAPLKQLIRDIYVAEVPMVGICFGHQVIAEAFDGKVAKYDGGWGVGQHYYQLADGWKLNDSASICLNAIHQDQVVIKPSYAEVFASSDFCRNAGLVYGDRILTVQAHPEFTTGYEKALLESLKEEVIPGSITEQGLATLEQDDASVDALMFARYMARFLRAASA
ncbi:glutamine amidotransferase-related protein [Amphritea sp. HPY]|uniref:glutamine amidotransferase-related protein n=1 Tax=Amphritea sp. HPY TaxID=3421652 RepID=UPI003D7E2E2B